MPSILRQVGSVAKPSSFPGVSNMFRTEREKEIEDQTRDAVQSDREERDTRSSSTSRTREEEPKSERERDYENGKW